MQLWFPLKSKKYIYVAMVKEKKYSFFVNDCANNNCVAMH